MEINHYNDFVLYVEDEDIVREPIANFLKKVIFPNLIDVSNPLDALKIYEQYQKEGIIISLLITDITMPDIDGFELIRRLRQINENLFVIVTSGLDFGTYFKEINSISVRTNYMNKPIDLRELLSLIKTTIKKIEENKKLYQADNLAKQYKNALDKSAIVSKTDKTGTIIYANDEFCKLSGYSKDELIGKKHNIVKSSIVNTSVYDDLWKAITHKKVFKYDNLPNKAKDGSIYYVNTTIIPILDSNNEIIEYLSIRFDNTALVKSLEEEKKAKETQTLFLANMSHEIRTPLNAIMGFTKLLSEASLSDEDKGFVNIIDDNAKLLVNTIGEILDFSKIKSGKMEVEQVFFNPIKEFTSIKELFFAVANQKNIKLKIKIDSRLNNLTLRSDITKIKQVLSNLLSNAIKFTPQNGTVTLKISLEKMNNNHASILFIVKDNGIGIDNEKINQIFNPFTQENQSTTREYGGTGLGLAICKEFIQLLGSELKVISKKNAGSMFHFLLDMRAKEKLEEKEIKNEKITFNNPKVLIAEDVEINQKLVDALLKKVNINANFVNNGQEAIDFFKENHRNLDLIILDINMPIMDGVEALKNINRLQLEYKTKIPLVALTANAIKGDKERFLKLGFDNYISKPINYDFLINTLKYYLDYSAEEVEDKKDIYINNNDTKTEKIVIDLEKNAEELSLPFEFYIELLQDFIKNIDYEIFNLTKYIEKEAKNEIHNQAHKLKGLSGNLGFIKLYNIFKKLETFENKEISLNLISEAKNHLDIIKQHAQDKI